MNCPTCGLDIGEHPASRCLDAWIAKMLFGWDGQRKSLKQLWPVKRAVPYYSTDMAAAWGIVETFRCGWRGHAAACIDIKISDWVNHPDCQVTIFAPDIVDVKAEAYSPCLAICRAALRVAYNES